jgi:hypothetical protein
VRHAADNPEARKHVREQGSRMHSAPGSFAGGDGEFGESLKAEFQASSCRSRGGKTNLVKITTFPAVRGLLPSWL